MKTKLTHNPIDKDHTTENPGLLPYAHTVGSALVQPEDVVKNKNLDLSAMVSQTDMQLDQIRKQMELLAEQAREIQLRKELSALIYEAKMGFKPIINHVYYLYQAEDGCTNLSLIAPNQWGKSKPFGAFLHAVRLLADHTWKIEKHEHSY